MNFLAHSFLSFNEPSLVVGNYLGDFITNKELIVLKDAIKKGVLLHRFIDSYTDKHPIVKTGTKLLHPEFRKYAPVVLDVYFDFLLSKYWSEFHPDPLQQHCRETYAILLSHRDQVPHRLAGRLTRMVADLWLENYQTYVGLQRTFSFIKRRSSFESQLHVATELLAPKEDELSELFLSFFPELVEAVKVELARRRRAYPSK